VSRAVASSRSLSTTSKIGGRSLELKKLGEAIEACEMNLQTRLNTGWKRRWAKATYIAGAIGAPASTRLKVCSAPQVPAGSHFLQGVLTITPRRRRRSRRRAGVRRWPGARVPEEVPRYKRAAFRRKDRLAFYQTQPCFVREIHETSVVFSEVNIY